MVFNQQLLVTFGCGWNRVYTQQHGNCLRKNCDNTIILRYPTFRYTHLSLQTVGTPQHNGNHKKLPCFVSHPGRFSQLWSGLYQEGLGTWQKSCGTRPFCLWKIPKCSVLLKRVQPFSSMDIKLAVFCEDIMRIRKLSGRMMVQTLAFWCIIF